MEWQTSIYLRDDLRAIGCEALCVAAATELIVQRSVSSYGLNGIITKLQDRGLWSSTDGLFKQNSYRLFIQAVCRHAGAEEYCGDMVSDSESLFPIRHYVWWKGLHNITIARHHTLLGNSHSILYGADGNIIFNPRPETELAERYLNLFFWIGLKTEWAEFTQG